jgi:hypothetical protein
VALDKDKWGGLVFTVLKRGVPEKFWEIREKLSDWLFLRLIS